MLQAILNGTAVMIFFILVFLEHDGPHEPAGRTAAGEQLELSKPLLGENVETIESYPAPM